MIEIELDGLNAAFDLTDDAKHKYNISEILNLINSILYLGEDGAEFEIGREEQLDILISYFREKLKEKNLAIAKITKQSQAVEIASGRAAAHRYLMDELGKSNSKFVRRILSGFAQAVA